MEVIYVCLSNFLKGENEHTRMETFKNGGEHEKDIPNCAHSMLSRFSAELSTDIPATKRVGELQNNIWERLAD